MFRFTTGERAPLYSAVLHAFGEAHERLVTALSLDEVRERLRGVGWFDALEDDDLVAALRQLREWRLVDAMQNHAGNYRTAEEYERRNLQYSLTRHGEAAFAGVQHALTVLASSGALQTAVLDAIADRLHALDALLADPASANRRVFATLQELEGHLDALRSNTKQFNGELQRLLHADGAELPPLAGGDPGPAWSQTRRARWEGLRAWFLPEDGAPARVEQLHHVARRAIVTLLQFLDRITQTRRRSSSAAEDFRELARWFAAAPSEADAHRLWATAFGLGPARHAHLVHADPETMPASARWSEAPPVEVSALPRSSGRTERFTRTGRVRDVAAVRADRAERARAERADLEAAWSLLRTRGPVRLSHVAELDDPAFERLLDLLGRALAVRPDAAGLRRAVTGDGRLAVDRAEADVAAREDSVRAAASHLAGREGDVTRAARALDSLAAEYGLPADERALDRLAEHAEALRESSGRWLVASGPARRPGARRGGGGQPRGPRAARRSRRGTRRSPTATRPSTGCADASPSASPTTRGRPTSAPRPRRR
ncbi:TIGR02677 family protein [Streptomyces radicis]|uniref:TIGR02677 family protein n=1 Tax=Streptomyces radicis TaxID=1750517 RepID=A0A3A9WM57_9ACTN|nr:TIGR02677 family protein [Streptomyces radicis]RKN10564.1 TIGR02677 family protein [Streptomyces radicis]RKN24824.1 TIGR02677 family protein [Streptomyces radicis]